MSFSPLALATFFIVSNTDAKATGSVRHAMTGKGKEVVSRSERCSSLPLNRKRTLLRRSYSDQAVQNVRPSYDLGATSSPSTASTSQRSLIASRSDSSDGKSYFSPSEARRTAENLVQKQAFLSAQSDCDSDRIARRAVRSKQRCLSEEPAGLEIERPVEQRARSLSPTPLLSNVLPLRNNGTRQQRSAPVSLAAVDDLSAHRRSETLTSTNPGRAQLHHLGNISSTASDASLAAELATALESPGRPARRALRERKAAQLAPYTTELARYKRRLIRNDWQDAVVVSKDIARALRAKQDAGNVFQLLDENAQSGVKKKANDGKHNRSGQEEMKRRKRHKRSERHDLVALSSLSNSTREKSTHVLSKVQRGSSATRVSYGNNDEEGEEEKVDDELDDGATEEALHPVRSHSLYTSDGSESAEEVLAVPRSRHKVVADSDSDTKSDASSTSSNLETVNDDQNRSRSLRLFKSGALGIDTASDDEDLWERSPVGQRHDSPALSMRQSSRSKDTRDYDQLFKMLKRTMPARMARAHIADLQAMDREVQEYSSTTNMDAAPSSLFRPDDIVVSVDDTVLPGQTRKRMAVNDPADSGRNERFALLGDSEDESVSRSPRSATREASIEAINLQWSESDCESSLSDASSVTDARPPEVYLDVFPFPDAVAGRRRVNGKANFRPKRRSHEDDIDRMLSRAHRASKGQKRQPQRRHADKQWLKNGKHSSLTALKTKKIGQTSHFKRPRQSLQYANHSATNSISYLRAPRPYDKHRARPTFSLSDDTLFTSSFTRDEAVLITASASKEVAVHKQEHGSMELHNISEKGTNLVEDWPCRNIETSRIDGQRVLYNDSSDLLDEKRSYDISRTNKDRQAIRNGRETGSHASVSTKDTLTSQTEETQREQASLWASVDMFRLTFDINPPQLGMRCDPDGYIGKGGLYSLLEESCAWSTEAAWEDFPGLEEAWSTLENEQDNCIQAGYIIENVVRQAFTLSGVRSGAFQHFDEFFNDLSCLARERMKEREKDSRFAIVSALQWARVDFLWRVLSRTEIADDTMFTYSDNSLQSAFLQACRELMKTLLDHGMHRTMASLKAAARQSDLAEQEATVHIATIKDKSVEHWVCLIHLLNCPKGHQRLQTQSSPFWPVLEDAWQCYREELSQTKTPLVQAENLWYTIFAICALGRLSGTTGHSSTRSALTEPSWSIVRQAVGLIRLRYDESVERYMAQACARKRDGYIRAIMMRVLVLVHDWHWRLEGSEVILARLFSLFDAYRLENLPSEGERDFPAFLREYDAQQLFTWPLALHHDTAFHLFLRILALAARQAEERAASSTSAEAVKAVSRILSRFSPVRSMAFTNDSVPTSLERSALYNHYSIALLYLFLVPSSDRQRLLQMQQYLRISKADRQSQVIGVRAIMYVMIVLLHRERPIEPAIAWFKTVFAHLMCQLDDLQRHAPSERGGELRRTSEIRSQITLVMTSLRALQYVVRRPTLEARQATTGFPNALLLDHAWTDAIFVPSTAIVHPSLAVEALQLLQCFIVQRQAIKQRASTRQSLSKESQDSYGDLFDDELDFEDPSLLQAAGYGSVASSVSNAESKKDEDFSRFLHARIAPSLFRLLVCMSQPDRATKYGLCIGVSPASLLDTAGKTRNVSDKIDALVDCSACVTMGHLVLECWAQALWILIEEHKIRTWDFVFRHGSEDPRHLLDDDARRIVIVELFNFALERGLASTSSASQSISAESMSITSKDDVYLANLVEVWTCFFTNLASASVPRHFASFVSLLRRHDARRAYDAIDAHDEARTTLFARISKHTQLTASDDDESFTPSRRHAMLLDVIKTLDDVVKDDGRCVAAAISATSAMLAVLRRALDKASTFQRNDERSGAIAVQRAQEIVSACYAVFTNRLMRGLATDLRNASELIAASSLGDL